MRQIGTLSHENEARRLVQYLMQEGIDCRCDVSFDSQTGQMSYQIWIRDEDQLEKAAKYLEEFNKNPTHPKYDIVEPPAPPTPVSEEVMEAPTHRFGTHLTFLLIGLCALLFFIGSWQEAEMVRAGQSVETIIPPIDDLLLFETPQVNASSWQGAYAWIIDKIEGKSAASVEGPLFLQIREGQLWRLFTPALLHANLLHILFNMLWLWYLGRPIEQRIGPFRMLVFTLAAGVFTNVLQYLMSGPLFLGYSGIVMALAGFTWMREKIAPWEGYPLNRGTILFLLLFVLAILGLQIASFVIQVFTSYKFAPNIANTAHIAGAVIGAVLARFKFFAQRIRR